jgi:hypothetical protein
MEKKTPKVAESVCLSHALSILALHQKQFSKDEEKRITETGNLILKLHHLPFELAPIASALIMRGVGSFATQECEEELEVVGAEYVKGRLWHAMKQNIEISSVDDIAKNLGLWFVGMINSFLFAPFVEKEKIIERITKEEPVEFKDFSPFEIMYVGWVLHTIALKGFFFLLPAQVFQLPSILKIAEGWLSLEAEIYPELRRPLLELRRALDD